MAGEWLAATANANMFTYEIAPVFIMMEHTVLLKMREVIGWEEGDSILAPGGSISNMSVFTKVCLIVDVLLSGMRSSSPGTSSSPSTSRKA